MFGRVWGGAAFREGRGGLVIMNREWHEGKGFKYGGRAQRRMKDIG